MKDLTVLGIETSCDETGLAMYSSQAGLLAHKLYSQVSVHAPYGGVVPELASRDHVRKTLPLLDQLLVEVNIATNDISAIAYTAGPGLIGALFTGAAIACSLAYGWRIPAIPIHHMEAHLLAPMLEDNPPSLPFIALLVSGGHTLLVKVTGLGEYQLLGESVDDAVGEAFDKTAKLLGLPYPGGPQLAKLADSGDGQRFNFPRPMTQKPGCNFSFSGLKTHVVTTWENSDKTEQTKADIARAFQDAVVETLTIKCRRALQQSKLNRLVVAGGVAANIALRRTLSTLMQQLKGQVFFPRPEFCTDNGAMIAYAGYRYLQAAKYSSHDLAIQAKARWPLAYGTINNKRIL